MSNYVRENPAAWRNSAYYIGVLKDAMEDSLEYDIGERPSVHQALEWLEKNTAAGWSIVQFRRALDKTSLNWSVRYPMLVQAYNRIKTDLEQ